MIWVPKLRYPVTSGTILTLTLPMRYWTERMSSIGGFAESASGTRAARTIRRDYLLDVVFRIDEGELADVQTFVAWAQDHAPSPFDFWPDKTGSSVSALLINPMQGSDLTPSRGESGSDLEVPLTLRKSDGTPWALSYYPAIEV